LADRPSCSALRPPFRFSSTTFQYPLADRPSCSMTFPFRITNYQLPFSILSLIAPHAAKNWYADYYLSPDLSVSSRGSPLMQLTSVSIRLRRVQTPFSILSRIAPHAAEMVVAARGGVFGRFGTAKPLFWRCSAPIFEFPLLLV